MRRAALLIMTGAIATAGGASAQSTTTITVCGASAGKSYQASGPPAGWADDGIAAGRITFVRKREGYDVVITDAVTTFSAREDGASIVVAPGSSAEQLTLIAAYPLGTVETYQLAVDAAGNGKLIWSALKNGLAGVVKGSLFTAACRRP